MLADGFGLQLFNFHLGNTVAIEFLHGVAVPFVFETLTLPWNLLQPGEDEAGQGFESGIARQEQLILRFKIANAG